MFLTCHHLQIPSNTHLRTKAWKVPKRPSNSTTWLVSGPVGSVLGKFLRAESWFGPFSGFAYCGWFFTCLGLLRYRPGLWFVSWCLMGRQKAWLRNKRIERNPIILEHPSLPAAEDLEADVSEDLVRLLLGWRWPRWLQSWFCFEVMILLVLPMGFLLGSSHFGASWSKSYQRPSFCFCWGNHPNDPTMINGSGRTSTPFGSTSPAPFLGPPRWSQCTGPWNSLGWYSSPPTRPGWKCWRWWTLSEGYWMRSSKGLRLLVLDLELHPGWVGFAPQGLCHSELVRL